MSEPLRIRRRTPAERLDYLLRARVELEELGGDPELLDLFIAEAKEDIPPGHGPGARRHGYVEGSCTEECDNRECARRLPHERCTEACDG